MEILLWTKFLNLSFSMAAHVFEHREGERGREKEREGEGTREERERDGEETVWCPVCRTLVLAQLSTPMSLSLPLFLLL